MQCQQSCWNRGHIWQIFERRCRCVSHPHYTDLLFIHQTISLSERPKVVKFKLLYKKDTKTDHKNFRPILLLPIVSKIVEKVIYGQAMEYLTNNNILYKYQSGFTRTIQQILHCHT